MKYIKKINEYRGQLTIPFDSKHPLHDKPIHFHVVDALEELSNKTKEKPDKYYSDDTNIKKYCEDAYEQALENYKNLDEEPYMAAKYMFYYYPPLENQELYNKDIIEDAKQAEHQDELYYEYIDILEENLTKKGEKIYYDKILQKCFDYELEEYDICNSIKLDEDGLINVWRAISYDPDDHKKDKDLYELIMDYGGVGVYWSYDEKEAESHCGSYCENTYLLHGKVKPEYVNWVGTLYKSAYNLKQEREIELKEGTEILIYKITLYTNDKEIPLKNEIVVPV